MNHREAIASQRDLIEKLSGHIDSVIEENRFLRLLCYVNDIDPDRAVESIRRLSA